MFEIRPPNGYALPNTSFPNQYTPPNQVVDHNGQPWQSEAGGNPAFALPSVETFQTKWQTPWRSYLQRYDEALRFDRKWAKSMYLDAFTLSLLNERILGTTSLNWHIEVEDEDDPEQKAIKDGLEAIINSTPHLNRMLKYLMEALWYGRHGAQLGYVKRTMMLPSVENPREKKPTETYVVEQHEPVNGDKIIYQWDGTPGIRVRAQVTQGVVPGGLFAKAEDSWVMLLKGSWRSRFVIHQHEIVDADFFEGDQAGGIHGVGIRSFIHWTEWLRKEWISNIADWSERTGLGIRIWRYQLGNPASYQATKNAAETQSDKTNILVGVSPNGGQENVEYANDRGSAVNLLLTMIEHLEDHIERYIIGQSLSSGTGESGLNGSGVAALHSATKGKIIAFDSHNLEDTLTQDWVRPLVHWTYPDYAGPPPRWKFVIDEEDRAQKMAAINAAVALGASVKETEVQEVAGITPPKDTDKQLSIIALQKAQNELAEEQQDRMQQKAMQQQAAMGGPPGTDGQQGPQEAGGGDEQAPGGLDTASESGAARGDPGEDLKGLAEDLGGKLSQNERINSGEDKGSPSEGDIQSLLSDLKAGEQDDKGEEPHPKGAAPGLSKITDADIDAILSDPSIGSPGHPSEQDIQELLASLGKSRHAKSGDLPRYFSCTHYGLPTTEQVAEFGKYPNLTAKDITRGVGYTIVGRGMRGEKQRQQIIEAINILADKYPDRPAYREAIQVEQREPARYAAGDSEQKFGNRPNPAPKAKPIATPVVDSLGLYSNTHHAIQQMPQAKMPVADFRKHLAKFGGTGYIQKPSDKSKYPQKHTDLGNVLHVPGHEADLVGMEQYLADKPHASQADLLQHVEKHTPKLAEVSQANAKPKYWIGDSGYTDRESTYDSHEAAEEAREHWIDSLVEDPETDRSIDDKIERMHPHGVDYDRVEPEKSDEEDTWDVDGTTYLSEDEANEAAEDLNQKRQQEAEDSVRQQLLEEARDEIADDVRIHEDDEGSGGPQAEDWSLAGPSHSYDEVHITAPELSAEFEPRPLLEGVTAKITDRKPIYEFGKQVHPGTRVVEYLDSKGQQLDSRKYHPDRAADKFAMTPEQFASDYMAKANAAISKENAKLAGEKRKWGDGHGFFEHIENPVGRIRHNIRTDADGKKMFFLEEVQSPKEEEKMPPWLRNKAFDILLKHAIVKAVKSGAERLGWTTGKQQADRYGLADKVDGINWGHSGADNENRDVVIKVKRGSNISLRVDPAGKITQGPSEAIGKPLSEVIGKEAASTILTSQAPNGDIPGDGLEIGGEGLKDAYDKVIPNKIKDILKKHGTRVGKGEVNVEGKSYKPRYSMDFDNNYAGATVKDNETGAVVGKYPDSNEAGRWVDANQKMLPVPPRHEPVWAIELTPEIKEWASKGIARYERPE